MVIGEGSNLSVRMLQWFMWFVSAVPLSAPWRSRMKFITLRIYPGAWMKCDCGVKWDVRSQLLLGSHSLGYWLLQLSIDMVFSWHDVCNMAKFWIMFHDLQVACCVIRGRLDNPTSYSVGPTFKPQLTWLQVLVFFLIPPCKTSDHGTIASCHVVSSLLLFIATPYSLNW
jgi:hypothetical protein